MSENLRNYTNALYAFDHVLKLTPDKALDKQSPCADWKGADVIIHTLWGIQYVTALASGGKPPAKGPKVGADPIAQFRKVRDQAIAALDQEGVLHKDVDSFFGTLPVDALLHPMGGDIAVHAWDLARTAKVDERLDPALVTWTMAAWKKFPDSMARQPGVLGPKVPSAKGADAQTRMLNFLGRKA